MTSAELVRVPRPERRRFNPRRYVAGAIDVIAELIRSAAIAAFIIVPAAAINPVSSWRPEGPWWAIAVVMLALLGVERIGLALQELSESIARPAPYTPRRPKHPAQ
ncbi:hypothetical protein ACPCK1_17705 [Streptomyces pseudogriseolus]|uniref:hypothetical protein n=1 Tax=Streptomyces pseudogriseolus TaxID=36817 RepID=UPI003FA31F94